MACSLSVSPRNIKENSKGPRHECNHSQVRHLYSLQSTARHRALVDACAVRGVREGDAAVLVGSGMTPPTTVRDRLREFTAKAQEHLKQADSYLTAITDLLNEDPAILSPHMQFREAWNTATKGTPLAACLKLTPGRIEKIKSRLSERPQHEWETIFAAIAVSQFCCGQNERGWVASFDWIIYNTDNGLKVLEGKYANRQTHGAKVVGHAAPTAGKYANLFSDGASAAHTPPDSARSSGPRGGPDLPAVRQEGAGAVDQSDPRHAQEDRQLRRPGDGRVLPVSNVRTAL